MGSPEPPRPLGFPGPLRLQLLGAELGEEDHVADRARVGEEHDETIHPHAHTAGRGHAQLERAQVVGIEELRVDMPVVAHYDDVSDDVTLVRFRRA